MTVLFDVTIVRLDAPEDTFRGRLTWDGLCARFPASAWFMALAWAALARGERLAARVELGGETIEINSVEVAP